MSEICGDNRFEIIERAKEMLINATNITDRPEEMAVLDGFLFTMWQMGLLDKICHNDSIKPDQFICSSCRAHYDIARIDVEVDEDDGIPNYCPNCGAKVVR